VVLRGVVGVLAAGPAWRAVGASVVSADVVGWREIVGRWWPLTEGAERDLGRRAAKMLGEGAGDGEMVRLLPPCRGVRWTVAGAEIGGDAEEALGAIDGAIAGEYAAGRVRVIDRWVLSESETAMFALLVRAERGR
jgi:hypothetical protein